MFGRSYLSTAGDVGDLGSGWQHTYEARVVASSRVVTLVGEVGQRAVYTRSADGTLLPTAGVRTSLRETEDGWEATRRDGSVLLFDADGQLARITDRLGFELIVSRQDGRVTEVTGHSGQRLRFEHEDDRLVRVSGSDGRAIVFEHDRRGRLVAATDAGGGTFRYAYDQDDRLTEVIDANGDPMVVNEYDDRGRVVAQLEGGLERWRFDYEGDGSDLSTVVTDPSGAQRIHRYRNRALISVEDGLGRTTTYAYDDDLNVTAVTDPRGARTTYTYDDHGWVSSVTPPAPFDVPERFEHDRYGNLLRHRAADGGVTTYTYDETGNLLEVTDPTGGTTQLSYDGRRGLASSLVRADGSEWHVEHDEFGRVVEERSPEGRGLRYRYTDTGDLAALTELGEAGTTWTFTWDDAGRLASTTDPAGASYHYEHDAVGQLVAVTGPSGDEVHYAYDPLYRLTGVTGGDGAVTRYVWEDGRLVRRIAPTGAATRFVYDAAGQLVEVTAPTGEAWRYGYDDAGNLTTVEEPNGLRTLVEPNTLGAPATIELPGNTVRYLYDPSGRLQAMHDELGRHDYAYDAVGRLTGITLDGTTTHAYTYDEVGNLREREVAGLDPTTFTYDGDGLPIGISAGDLEVTQRFDGSGRLVERQYDNGVTATLAYDDRGHLARILTRDPQGRTVDAHTYRYDPQGRPLVHRTMVEETVYAYDAQGRLTEAVTSQRGTGEELTAISYEYDAAGRRVAEVRDGETTTYRYDDADQLLEIEGPAGLVEYRYDASGNRVAAGGTSFEYGALGRLEGVRAADGTGVDYLHDGAGVRRAARSTDGSRTDYHWDLAAANYPLLGLDGPGAVERYLVGPGGGVLAASIGEGETLTVHTDALGSVTALAEANGAVAGAYAYEPFGARRSLQGDDPLVALGFTGEQHDPVSELVHLRLRDLDPAIGQFTTLDPAPHPAAMPYTTPYHYGFNAPTVFSDPSGACPWCVVTGAIGATVNVGINVGGALIRGERPTVGGVAGAAAEGFIVGAVSGTGVGLVGVVGAGLAGNAVNQVTRHSLDRSWGEYRPVASAVEFGLSGVLAAGGSWLSTHLQSPITTASGRVIGPPSVDPQNVRAVRAMDLAIHTHMGIRQEILMLPFGTRPGATAAGTGAASTSPTAKR
jgi:RHS repeat-associated protein